MAAKSKNAGVSREPPNMEAIMDWVRERRPDMLPYMEQLMEKTKEGDQLGDAYILLMSTCFTAGRVYQHKYPTLNPTSQYHR